VNLKLPILLIMFSLLIFQVSCANMGSSKKTSSNNTDEFSLDDDLDDDLDDELSESNNDGELDINDDEKDDKREISSEKNAYAYGKLKGNKYKVQKSDTLMIIAFKIYGDYTKWRELKRLNSKKVNRNNSVKKGTTLIYNPPKNKYVYKPIGNPYLIKKGDTLGIISNNVYDTPKKWKKIWDNNRKLIKNPNLIFAGFTLYYVPENNTFAYKY
jgi:nucleoid-associated protein YgaU